VNPHVMVQKLLYPLATKRDFDDFRDICDSKSKDWKIVLNDETRKITVLEERIPNSTINRIKMKAHMVNIPAAALYDVLHDSEYRKVWDMNMAEAYTIALLDPYNDIGYYAGKSPFFAISGRDFCNHRSWWVSGDGSEYIIMNHSVTHPTAPVRKQYVRGLSYETGYILRRDPDDDNSCFLIYCTQTDLKGWIPDKLVNKAIKTFAPNLVEKMMVVVPSYAEWKQCNNPENKPWLSSESYHWERKKKEFDEENSPKIQILEEFYC